jgi:hypothetical protein
MRPFILFVAFLALTGCADHASALRSRIEAATSDLDQMSGDAAKEVTFAPTGPNRPYTIIFFPERRVFETELIARGVEPVVAKRIFHELSRYGVGEKEAPMVVVVEPGKKLSFASYSGRELVHIDDLLVASKPGGDVVLALEKRGETYYLTHVR